jgi:hypothetical protein
MGSNLSFVIYVLAGQLSRITTEKEAAFKQSSMSDLRMLECRVVENSVFFVVRGPGRSQGISELISNKAQMLARAQAISSLWTSQLSRLNSP